MQIQIPGIDFAELKLARDADGAVSFDTAVIERIEQANGLPAGYFMQQPEDALAQLLVTWYRLHLAAGGQPDPVAADLFAEAELEQARGVVVSHAPGRA